MCVNFCLLSLYQFLFFTNAYEFSFLLHNIKTDRLIYDDICSVARLTITALHIICSARSYVVAVC